MQERKRNGKATYDKNFNQLLEQKASKRLVKWKRLN